MTFEKTFGSEGEYICCYDDKTYFEINDDGYEECILIHVNDIDNLIKALKTLKKEIKQK